MDERAAWRQQVERLMAATRQHNDPEPSPPADDADLDALAAHWGAALPPSYRQLLLLHRSGIKLWFDCLVLSPWLIRNGTHAPRFTRSALARWIFALDEHARAALAFDFHAVDARGEAAVVRLDASGEVRRWPSLPQLGAELNLRLMLGVHGQPDRVYCFWTNLWTPWASDSAESSRAFHLDNRASHTLADDKRLAGRAPPPANPFLSEAELAEADRRFTAAAAPIIASQRKLTVVLTSADGLETSHGLYVLYEPLADFVMGLDVVRRASTITTHEDAWRHHDQPLREVMRGVDHLLHEHRVADALYLALEEACRLTVLVTTARARS